MVKGVGFQSAKQLMEEFNSPKELFKEVKKTKLKSNISKSILSKVKHFKDFERVEEEVRFVRKKGIEVLFFTDEKYPQKLLQLNDAPIVLYYKGTVGLNELKHISIVGSREISKTGEFYTQKIVKELEHHNPIIISGLAYGVDTAAHRHSLKNGLNTIGVLAHGLDRIYPSSNQSLALKMIKQGGLLTEFRSGTNPDRENFPKRNRIVAGMSDLTIVTQSTIKGGSLITAKLANDYFRDVFAFPYSAGLEEGAGCNWLIKENRAALIEGVEDLENMMNWKKHERVDVQRKIFMDLTEKEQVIVNKFLEEKSVIHIDDLSFALQQPMSLLSGTLLELEFKGIIQSLPGKNYQLV